MDRLPKRAVAVKRLDKLPPLPAAYLSFVQHCESVEITPGIRLWDYPTALGENRAAWAATIPMWPRGIG